MRARTWAPCLGIAILLLIVWMQRRDAPARTPSDRELPAAPERPARSLEPEPVDEARADVQAPAAEDRDSLSLRGSIVDAIHGEPVPVAKVLITLTNRDGNDRTIFATARNGVLDLHWKPNPGEAPGDLRGRAEIRAKGFKTRRVELDFLPGQRVAKVEARLDPLAPCNHLLEVVDGRGDPVTEPLTVLSGVPLCPVRFEDLGDGRLRVHGIAGRRPFAVALATQLGQLRWSGEIEFVEGREDMTRCQLPPFGVIVVRCGAAAEADVSFESPDDTIEAVLSIVDGERRVAVAPGEWRLASGSASRRVPVRSGTQVVVEFSGD